MKHKLKNQSFRSSSLHDTRTARSVLLQMAADQDRAERIQALKQARPDLTWRAIADHVGVSERAAANWKNGGGIEYDNAKKLAEIFEVDVDYIWRGNEPEAPSPFAGRDELADRLDRIESQLAELTEIVRAAFIGRTEQGDAIITRLGNLERALSEKQDALLPGVRDLLQELEVARPGASRRSAGKAT